MVTLTVFDRCRILLLELRALNQRLCRIDTAESDELSGVGCFVAVTPPGAKIDDRPSKAGASDRSASADAFNFSGGF